MTEQELQRVIDKLQSSLGSFNSSLSSIHQRMQDIASGADAAQREHHKSVEQLGRWNKKSDELNRARLDQQYKDLQEAKALEQQLIDSKKKVLVALDKNRKAIEKKAEVLKKAAADERAGVAGATAARKAAQAALLFHSFFRSA